MRKSLLNRPLERITSLCQEDPFKNVKVSFQSIKCLFPPCQVKLPPLGKWVDKKKKTEQVDIVGSSSSESFDKSKIIKKEACELKRNTGENTVHSSWEDHFIDIEWDTGENQQQYYNDKIENKPNVIVREILVLKPKWLKDCKKVIFRDCHVTLTKFPQVKLEEGLKAKAIKKENKLVQEEPESSRTSNSVDNENVTPVKNKEKSSKIRRAGKYQCELCNKAFREKYLLFQHLTWHTGEKPYKCNTCGRRFRLSQNFGRHVRLHTDGRPYKCSRCKATFKRKEHLRNHMRNHTGAKPYKCKECKDKFGQLYQLKIHMELVHGSQSPYSCKFCMKGFSKSSRLNKHIKLGRCAGSKRLSF